MSTRADPNQGTPQSHISQSLVSRRILLALEGRQPGPNGIIRFVKEAFYLFLIPLAFIEFFLKPHILQGDLLADFDFDGLEIQKGGNIKKLSVPWLKRPEFIRAQYGDRNNIPFLAGHEPDDYVVLSPPDRTREPWLISKGLDKHIIQRLT